MRTATLNNAFDLYNCDKGTRHPDAHRYAPAYARAINAVGDDISSVLEIGVKRGRSIAAWKDVFPTARIVGVDIEDVFSIEDGYTGVFPRCPDPSTWEFVQGDSRSAETASKISGNFDMIVDDGSHNWHDQFETFKNFKDRFNKIFVIEDIVGHRHERFLRDSIKTLGFTNFVTFDSHLEMDIEYIKGQGEQRVKALMMVIFKNADVQLAG